MAKRLIYILSCGLMLAVIVHILIILLIPFFGERDAAKQISKGFSPGKFHLIENETNIGIANKDPHMKLSVCNFDLSNNAVEITGPDISTFWSASVFDQRGRVIYSMNDRTAINNKLKVIIVNPIQMADIRQLQPIEIESAILVEAQENNGFVLLRALIPDPSWEEKVNNFLNQAECDLYETNDVE